MNGNFKKEKIPFTQVANEVITDPTLSLKAKGMYAYLFSKPDDWDFETNRIAKENSDGRDSVRKAIKELENRGYLKRVKLADRKMEYILKYSIKPMTENQSLTMTENANDGNSHSRKIRHISNIEAESNIDKESNIDILQPQILTKQIAEIIHIFESINPTISYGHLTIRNAATTLISQFGFNRASAYARAAVAVHGKSYAPTISDPYKLKLKLSDLAAYYKREKEKKVAACPLSDEDMDMLKNIKHYSVK